nr:hypothetical protein [Actinokineospora spheciospongiae]
MDQREQRLRRRRSTTTDPSGLCVKSPPSGRSATKYVRSGDRDPTTSPEATSGVLACGSTAAGCASVNGMPPTVPARCGPRAPDG